MSSAYISNAREFSPQYQYKLQQLGQPNIIITRPDGIYPNIKQTNRFNLVKVSQCLLQLTRNLLTLKFELPPICCELLIPWTLDMASTTLGKFCKNSIIDDNDFNKDSSDVDFIEFVNPSIKMHRSQVGEFLQKIATCLAYAITFQKDKWNSNNCCSVAPIPIFCAVF